MNVLLQITWAEFRTQVRRPILWIAFGVVSALMLWETLPVAANFHRLTDLPNPTYAAARLVSLSTPLFALLAALLCSGRVHLTVHPGLDACEWTTPGLRVERYLLGKFLGNFLAVVLLPASLCALGMLIRFALLPDAFMISPYLTAYLLLGVLPLIYMVALALLVGALANLYFARVALLLYILWSEVLATSDLHGVSPIYRMVGDLYTLVYSPDGLPFANLRQSSGWQTLEFDLLMSLLSLLILWVALSATQYQRLHGFHLHRRNE